MNRTQWEETEAATLLKYLCDLEYWNHAALRRAGCAAVRTVWDLLSETRSREAVEQAEAYCRNEINSKDLDKACGKAYGGLNLVLKKFDRRGRFDEEKEEQEEDWRTLRARVCAAQAACAITFLDPFKAVESSFEYVSEVAQWLQKAPQEAGNSKRAILRNCASMLRSFVSYEEVVEHDTWAKQGIAAVTN